MARREIPIGGRTLGFALIVEDGGSIRRLGTAISTHRKVISDWLPFFKDLEKELLANERKLFASQGASAGRKWAGLSDNPKGKGYKTRKRKKYGRRKILVASGTLRNALTKKHHPHALRIAHNDQFAFGTQGLEYPRPHQNGYKVRTRDGIRMVPARRPLDWDDTKFQARVVALLRRHANRGARRAGFRPVGPGPRVSGSVIPRKGFA